MDINAWQLCKSAIKVTNLMIRLMFEYGSIGLTFDATLPVADITQKCADFFTCVCPPHLCIYSFARFHRATFNSVFKALKRNSLPVCFTTSVHPETITLNPLYDALKLELHPAEYIKVCLEKLYFRVIVDEKAESLTYYVGLHLIKTMPICTFPCLCCPTIVRNIARR